MEFSRNRVVTIFERFQSHSQRFKYFLAVSFLVVIAFASFKFGNSSTAVASNSLEDDVLPRERRDVTIPPQPNQVQGGIVYTRWGRTECPEGADWVYSGVAGGSLFANHGGGANPLCLPMDPLWGTYNEAVEKGSKLYGSEYQSPSGFDLKNAGGRSINDHNIPCVVCHSETKSSVLMIPARNRCYGDWKEEYSGYLMAGNSGHEGRSEFICMDLSPESDPAGFRNEDGAVFYNVEGVCGSLPCPPYVPSREITCVVCTK